MALVIEDGTGVEGANSFNTRAEIIGYAAARGVTIPDEDASDAYAIRAMDYLAVQDWCGISVYVGQTTAFPRKGIIDGDLADDFEYTIPLNIKMAQAQLALDAFNGIDLLPSRSAERQVKREKVGPLETEYFGPAAYSPDLPFVAALIAAFLCGQGFKLRTYRA